MCSLGGSFSATGNAGCLSTDGTGFGNASGARRVLHTGRETFIRNLTGIRVFVQLLLIPSFESLSCDERVLCWW